MHVRRGDNVQVMRGEDAGKRGRILRTIPEQDRVVVESVNMVFRHMRRSQQHPQGGRVRKEAPIHVSTVQIFCESCDRPVRVRAGKDDDGKKIRVCATCAKPIPDPNATKSKKK
jgi:large subunit ribosomal protein L24